MNYTHINNLHPLVSLVSIGELQALHLNFAKGEAIISYQGAQLLHWQPKGCEKVIWLSDVDPLKQGNAIRGGIPVCFPWFANKHTPVHGYARTRLWQLGDIHLSEEQAVITWKLFAENGEQEAALTMTFSDELELAFDNFLSCNEIINHDAELALHSYFYVGDIDAVSVHHLPSIGFDKISQSQQVFEDPLRINRAFDTIYQIKEQLTTQINDSKLNRIISITHHNSSNIVLWNPFNAQVSGMSESGFRTMLCVETARIDKPLSANERMGVTISVQKLDQ